MNNYEGSSRANFRAKRKKTKLILTGSIIGIILIVFVSYAIFSADHKVDSPKNTQASTENQSAQGNNQDKPTEENGTTDNDTNEDTASRDQSQNDTMSGNDASSSDSALSNSTVAPETPEQTGMQHVTNYDSSSQDWQDMLLAISSSTGIDQGNMTVWFLGSDKSNPGGSVGTVSAKEKGSQKYRVFLQWNGAGYTATKIEPAS